MDTQKNGTARKGKTHLVVRAADGTERRIDGRKDEIAEEFARDVLARDRADR